MYESPIFDLNMLNIDRENGFKTLPILKGFILELLQNAGFRDITISLTITPWLSGNMGFRFLPALSLLAPIYYGLDWLTSSAGIRVSTKLCTQMIILARIE